MFKNPYLVATVVLVIVVGILGYRNYSLMKQVEVAKA
jgi:hypothetical protein